MVVVLGATADDPPPGIEAAADVLELRYAPDADSLGVALPGAQALFFWHGEREELESRVAGRGRPAMDPDRLGGVDGLLFPELVDSDVVVTNARGVFDEPIAEWVIGAMLAFATGLHRSIVDQQAGVWGQRSKHGAARGQAPHRRGAGSDRPRDGQPRPRPRDDRDPGRPERSPTTRCSAR